MLNPFVLTTFIFLVYQSLSTVGLTLMSGINFRYDLQFRPIVVSCLLNTLNPNRIANQLAPTGSSRSDQADKQCQVFIKDKVAFFVYPFIERIGDATSYFPFQA